jgi:Ca2+-binding RTX toxin-like protein
MASFTFYAPTNMNRFDWFYDLPTSTADLTGKAIRMSNTVQGNNTLTPDEYTAVYYGSFKYGTFSTQGSDGKYANPGEKLGVISGTLTGYDFYEDQVIRASITDLSFDIVTALIYIDLGQATTGPYAGYDVELLEQLMAGGDNVQGSAFDDVLNGFNGNDSIAGGLRHDRLFGENGNDSLDGGAGRDSLTGGTGRDLLKGGAGVDTFVFETAADSARSKSTADVISDFSSGTDRIDVSAIDAIAGGLDDFFSFVGTGPFSGRGQIRAVDSGEDTVLQFNISSAKGAEMMIVLRGVDASDLTSGDFIL